MLLALLTAILSHSHVRGEPDFDKFMRSASACRGEGPERISCIAKQVRTPHFGDRIPQFPLLGPMHAAILTRLAR